MVRQAPISLEALKLKLISSSSKPASASDPLLTKDGIHYLLKALVYADNSFSTEIENVLVKAGALAIPELVKSLATAHINVRSTAAMALIRMGIDAEEAILQAYPKYSRKAATRWVFEFVMQELGLKIPHRTPEFDSPVLPLEKVG